MSFALPASDSHWTPAQHQAIVIYGLTLARNRKVSADAGGAENLSSDVLEKLMTETDQALAQIRGLTWQGDDFGTAVADARRLRDYPDQEPIF